MLKMPNSTRSFYSLEAVDSSSTGTTWSLCLRFIILFSSHYRFFTKRKEPLSSKVKLSDWSMPVSIWSSSWILSLNSARLTSIQSSVLKSKIHTPSANAISEVPFSLILSLACRLPLSQVTARVPLSTYLTLSVCLSCSDWAVCTRLCSELTCHRTSRST